MEKAATNLAPDAVTSSGVRETWDMIAEEPLDAHQGSRQDLHEAFADRLPQKREPKPETEKTEQGYRQPQASKSRHKVKPSPNRRPILIALSIVSILALTALLSYGLWP